MVPRVALHFLHSVLNAWQFDPFSRSKLDFLYGFRGEWSSNWILAPSRHVGGYSPYVGQPASGNRIGTAKWMYNALPFLVLTACRPLSVGGLATIRKIANHSVSLTRNEARDVLAEVLPCECTGAQIGALPVALRMKGETAAEFVGFAQTIRTAGKTQERGLPIESSLMMLLRNGHR